MSGDDPFPGQYLGQPVTFEGTWLPKGTLYVADRDLHGKRGYWVMTPVLVGDSAMPVVRGWSAHPEAPEPSGPVEVSGYLQASEGTGATDDDPEDDVIPEMRIASVVEHVDADLYSAYVVAKDAGAGTRRAGEGDAVVGAGDLEHLAPAQPALRLPVVDLRRFRDLHLAALVPRPARGGRRAGRSRSPDKLSACATSSPPTVCSP